MSTTVTADLPIRPLSRQDLAACADLTESRGWPRDEHKWGLLLAAGTGYGVDDPDSGALIGTCTLTRYGVGARISLSAVGMVLVAPSHAGQGLGSRLLRHVLGEAEEAPLSLYATDCGLPLYERHGFTSVGRSQAVCGTFRGKPEAHGLKVRPATGEDISGVLRLDEEVFGADRTHLIARLPAFSSQFLVAERRGKLRGYAAAWPATNQDVIGPLIAEDTATARALISTLAAGTTRELRTDIDTRHVELLDWAREHGLHPRALSSLMVHGAQGLPGDGDRRFAPLTVAAG